jgi:nitrogen fixation protein NifQ
VSVPALIPGLGPAPDAEAIHARLLVHAAGAGNDTAFAAMIATRAAGGGALPPWLGLEPAAFRCLLRHHFPTLRPGTLLSRVGGVPVHAATAADDRFAAQSVDRRDERDDLIQLMLMHKAGSSPSEVWMAHVVAAGCMGSDHLWEDLGLRTRAQLTDLMRRNYPTLAVRNVKDMKWKRFLYKQLCEAEGIYTCRAPSCEVCRDYDVCFGPE